MSDTIKSDFQEFLEDHAEDIDYTVRSYSGRSMYGKNCIGIDTDNVYTTIALLAFQAGQDDFEHFQDLIDSMRVDSMGKGSILYWPKETFVETVDLCERCSVALCNHCGKCHAEDCSDRVEQSSDDCDGEGPDA